MIGYLREKGLYMYIKSPSYDETANQYQPVNHSTLTNNEASQDKIFGVLQQSCEGAAGALLESVESERGIDGWMKLKHKYEGKNKTTMRSLATQLSSLRFDPAKQDIDEYFREATYIQERLQAMKVTLPDTFLMAFVEKGLPPAFDHVRSAILVSNCEHDTSPSLSSTNVAVSW